jgi:hypothetical protein
VLSGQSLACGRHRLSRRSLRLRGSVSKCGPGGDAPLALLPSW